MLLSHLWDVLRHAYISYHCAKYHSIGATALQAGNSKSIVRKHSLKMVAKCEAEKNRQAVAKRLPKTLHLPAFCDFSLHLNG